MRWLEVRRHSLTKKDSARGRGSHLSAEGVVLARQVGESLGPFALVIGHGGGIEPGLVACLPDADHQPWGPPFSHCDGARLGFHDGRFVGVQFLRVVP